MAAKHAGGGGHDGQWGLVEASDSRKIFSLQLLHNKFDKAWNLVA